MRPAGLRVVVAFAVVVAALGVGLASTSGSASAQVPPSGTITTQLQPGWNMIGWLGPDTRRRRTLRGHPGAELHRRLGRRRAALPLGLAGESGAAGAALDPRGPGAGPAHRGRVGRRVDAPGGRGGRTAAPARGKQPGHLGRTRRDADRGRRSTGWATPSWGRRAGTRPPARASATAPAPRSSANTLPHAESRRRPVGAAVGGRELVAVEAEADCVHASW